MAIEECSPQNDCTLHATVGGISAMIPASPTCDPRFADCGLEERYVAGYAEYQSKIGTAIPLCMSGSQCWWSGHKTTITPNDLDDSHITGLNCESGGGWYYYVVGSANFDLWTDFDWNCPTREVRIARSWRIQLSMSVQCSQGGYPCNWHGTGDTVWCGHSGDAWGQEGEWQLVGVSATAEAACGLLFESMKGVYSAGGVSVAVY